MKRRIIVQPRALGNSVNDACAAIDKDASIKHADR